MSRARTQNTLKSWSRNLKSQNVSGSQRKMLVSPSHKVSHSPFATPYRDSTLNTFFLKFLRREKVTKREKISDTDCENREQKNYRNMKMRIILLLALVIIQEVALSI